MLDIILSTHTFIFEEFLPNVILLEFVVPFKSFIATISPADGDEGSVTVTAPPLVLQKILYHS